MKKKAKKSKRNRHTGRNNYFTQCIIDAAMAASPQRTGVDRNGRRYAWGPDHLTMHGEFVSKGTVVIV